MLQRTDSIQRELIRQPLRTVLLCRRPKRRRGCGDDGGRSAGVGDRPPVGRWDGPNFVCSFSPFHPLAPALPHRAEAAATAPNRVTMTVTAGLLPRAADRLLRHATPTVASPPAHAPVRARLATQFPRGGTNCYHGSYRLRFVSFAVYLANSARARCAFAASMHVCIDRAWGRTLVVVRGSMAAYTD